MQSNECQAMIVMGRNAKLVVDGVRIRLYPVSDAFDNDARADARMDAEFRRMLGDVRKLAKQGWKAAALTMPAAMADAQACDHFAERFRRLGYRASWSHGFNAIMEIDWSKA